MVNFYECLICRNPSQTDIDGKGNSKKKMKGSNIVQSQLRSVFLLKKLLQVPSSTCIDLLKNSHGLNPSTWFSCCWNCYTIVEEAEKIFNAITKLEKQLQNLKTAMQAKLWENYGDELKISKSVVLSEKKNENIVNTIRAAAIERIGLQNRPTASEVTKEERLIVENNIKIEADEANLDTAIVSDFPDDDKHKSPANGDLQAVSSSSRRKISKFNKVNIPRRTRSGRLIKSRLSTQDTTSDSSSGDKNDESDNHLSNGESDDDCQEENNENELNNSESPRSSPSLMRISKTGNKHMKTAINYETKFKCKYCENSFRTSRLRYKHETQVHENLYKFQCDHCRKKYLKLEYLHLHLRRCHNGKVNADPSCTLMLKRLAPRGASRKCEECNKEFKTTAKLREHITCVHRKERNYVCEVCSESFSCNVDLKHHQLRKHGKSEEQKSIQCKECGKILGNPRTLAKHINIVHKKEFPFRCSICNVGKIYQSALDLHIMQAHTEGPRPHACTLCEKTYGRKEILVIHMRTHTGERPFKCSFCESRFFSKSRMVRHERSLHATEKRFQCEQCGNRFPSQHYLNSHVYSTHNKKVSSIVPKKLMDKQELVKYVESVNQSVKEKSETTKGNQKTTSIYRLHIEQQLKQNELLNKSCKESGNGLQTEITET